MFQTEEKLSAMTEVKKVHVRPDPASITTPEERAILEILLELCNTDLDVEITELEVKEMAEVYWNLYKIKPFVGLHELLFEDKGVNLFFQMFRTEVLPLGDATTRRKQVVVMFKKFFEASAELEQTPYLVALRRHAYNLVLFSQCYKLALQTQKTRTQWVQ